MRKIEVGDTIEIIGVSKKRTALPNYRITDWLTPVGAILVLEEVQYYPYEKCHYVAGVTEQCTRSGHYQRGSAMSWYGAKIKLVEKKKE